MMTEAGSLSVTEARGVQMFMYKQSSEITGGQIWGGSSPLQINQTKLVALKSGKCSNYPKRRQSWTTSGMWLSTHQHFWGQPGAWVVPLTTRGCQGWTGSGGCQRRFPIGGVAYGTAWKRRYLSKTKPRTAPSGVCTIFSAACTVVKKVHADRRRDKASIKRMFTINNQFCKLVCFAREESNGIDYTRKSKG